MKFVCVDLCDLQFATLFASSCQLGVTLNMWDVYLQQQDQFLVFFLALVILVNAKYAMLSVRECDVGLPVTGCDSFIRSFIS